MTSVANADSILDLVVLLCAAAGTVWFALGNRAAQRSHDPRGVSLSEPGVIDEDD
jgi:hypothetical protein